MKRTFLPACNLPDGSRFCASYLYEGYGNCFLLNQETGSSLCGDATIAQMLTDSTPNEALKFRLIQRGFISRPDQIACSYTEPIRPQFFIFDLTQACNFRCIYCFRHLETAAETISQENLIAITEYIIRYCQKYNIQSPCIQPWGGEPLIAFDRILLMDDLFRKHGLTPLISIETNAGLITEEIAQEAAARNIRLGISIDGHAIVHNYQRPKFGGHDSFDDMRRGVEIVSKYDQLKKFGVVSVLTSYGFPHLDEILEFFATELHVRCFKLNLIKDNPVMQEKGLCLTEAQITEAQQILVRKLVELNRRGYAITELNVQEKLLNLLIRGKSNICTSRGCMGGVKMIAFDQEGRIYPCDITDYKEEAIGSVYDHEDLVDLLQQARPTREFFTSKRDVRCDDCPVFFYCKGGCTTAIKYMKGRIDGIDTQECAANRALYPALIELILSNPEMIEPLTRGNVRINSAL